jgi:hypothetical protein
VRNTTVLEIVLEVRWEDLDNQAILHKDTDFEFEDIYFVEADIAVRPTCDVTVPLAGQSSSMAVDRRDKIRGTHWRHEGCHAVLVRLGLFSCGPVY